MHRADVSEVVNACDAGREGELIFRFVYEAAGCKKPMRRLWIPQWRTGQSRRALLPSKTGRNTTRLASALCRAKADWLIGINATRLFLLPVWKDLERGARPDPDLKNAHRPGRGYLPFPERKILSCAPRFIPARKRQAGGFPTRQKPTR